MTEAKQRVKIKVPARFHPAPADKTLDTLDATGVAYTIRAGTFIAANESRLPLELQWSIERQRLDLAYLVEPYKNECAACKGRIRGKAVKLYVIEQGRVPLYHWRCFNALEIDRKCVKVSDYDVSYIYYSEPLCRLCDKASATEPSDAPMHCEKCYRRSLATRPQSRESETIQCVS